MGMPDIASKIFMKNPEVFADLFNFVIHDGKQEITEKMLNDKDSTALLILPTKEETVDDNEGSEKVKSKQKDKGVQKYRDVFKELVIKKDSSAEYIFVGEENEKEITYSIVPTVMTYDSLAYMEQIREIANEHRKSNEKGEGGEFLRGFHKEDKLKPVITVVVYWGTKEWDAATSLHELFDIKDKHYLKYVPNYNITLLKPMDIEEDDFSKFHTELGPVLKLVKHSENKNSIETCINSDLVYKDMSPQAVRLINAVTGANFKIRDGEERIDMSKGFEEIKEEYTAEGRAEGRAEGKVEGMISALSGLVEKGLITLAQAANEANMSETEFERNAKMQKA